MFFDYASYTSVLAWMAFFGYSHLKAIFTKASARWKSKTKISVNEQYTDRLNVLMRSYEEIPLWWFIALFLCSFTIILTILASGHLYIPIWTYFIALATGAIVVIVCSASPTPGFVLTPAASRMALCRVKFPTCKLICQSPLNPSNVSSLSERRMSFSMG